MVDLCWQSYSPCAERRPYMGCWNGYFRSKSSSQLLQQARWRGIAWCHSRNSRKLPKVNNHAVTLYSVLSKPPFRMARRQAVNLHYVTHLHLRMFPPRNRPVALWSTFLHIWHQMYFLGSRIGLWSLESTRPCTPSDPWSPHRDRASCPVPTGPRSCFHLARCKRHSFRNHTARPPSIHPGPSAPCRRQTRVLSHLPNPRSTSLRRRNRTCPRRSWLYNRTAHLDLRIYFLTVEQCSVFRQLL